jgi:hypothetical protein
MARVHPVAEMLQHIYVGSVSEGTPERDCQVRKQTYLHDNIAGGSLRCGVGTLHGPNRQGRSLGRAIEA